MWKIWCVLVIDFGAKLHSKILDRGIREEGRALYDAIIDEKNMHFAVILYIAFRKAQS